MSVKSLLRKWYGVAKQNKYYINKYLQSFGKIVVIYNKNHPIYTVAFEELPAEKYLYVFIQEIEKASGWQQLLLNKAKVIHSDAPFFPFDFNRFKDKLIVAECEAWGKPLIYEDARVKVIYVESKYAISENPKNEKIKLLYPGIKYNPASRQPKPDGSPIVLSAVGYGGMIKGFDVVYKLYKTLKKEFPIKLIIAGSLGHDFNFYPEITKEAYDAADFDKIAAELKADPDVTFGYKKRDQLFAEVYPQTDIYIQMSRMDTFGFTVLEAMSFGLPIISTSHKALPEMVVDGENGYIVNDFTDDINSQEWFNKSYEESLVALRKLLQDKDLRTRMGQKSKDFVAQKFDAKIRRQIVEADYDKYLSSM